jgi:non-heme chloroperoxidase
MTVSTNRPITSGRRRFLWRRGRWLLIGPTLWAIVLTGLITFGTTAPPPPLREISEPMRRLDLADLPSIQLHRARDGAMLGFRSYGAGNEHVVVLIHGSSGSSRDMHGLAKAIASETATVYAIDGRGHGGSGRRGDIDYLGQLDDDLADLVTTVIRPAHAGAVITLVGFSSGAGFALRIGGGRYGDLFDRYLLLSPYLAHDAPTTRQGGAGGHGRIWARPFLPRIIGLTILNRLGLHWFDDLPVVAFAVAPGTDQTATYSFRLLHDFGADGDYIGDFRKLARPTSLIVGENDELLQPSAFDSLLHPVRPDIETTLLPNLGHMAMITEPAAFAAIRRTLGQ